MDRERHREGAVFVPWKPGIENRGGWKKVGKRWLNSDQLDYLVTILLGRFVYKSVQIEARDRHLRRCFDRLLLDFNLYFP